MEVPPPYPQMPMPRKNTKLIWGIVIGVLAVCCIGVGFMVFFFSKAFGKVMPIFGCGFKFQDIRSAVLHYANEHNGMLPNAKTWQDDIQPDLGAVHGMLEKERGPFGAIKPGDDFACNINEVKTGIAFNSDLSGKSLEEAKKQTNAILIYEIRDVMKNASGPYIPQTGSAPKVMDAPRGWFAAPVEGPIMVDFANGKKIRFEGNNPKIVNSDGTVANGG